MSSFDLDPGVRAEVKLLVGDDDTAIAHRSGDVPVLATPRVVALCEEATVSALAGALDDATTSVGARVEIEHKAPSQVGDEVTAIAQLVEVNRRQLTFDVALRAADGSRLAEGRIQRVIVDRARFLAAGD
ncbi:MAG: thioesterase [Akkermansiaceae bacterium]|nr:thioesterase [Akkermansiaceae bacterium]